MPTIFVGSKPATAYVIAALSAMNGDPRSCSVQARGRNISKAVDVVEILRQRFAPGLKIDSITIGTDTFEEDQRKVSKIAIDITNP